MAPSDRSASRIYRETPTEADLELAQAELRALEGDVRLRGEKPAQYRAAVQAARARIETIQFILATGRPNRSGFRH
ncbi:hypothetical protein [Chthonobacter rhizosphaerae]|uniref:hypothetical protein n=1 Tax=Chthonobacter rhizosphaerae TaxID=2735553 RepID=UPI0015EF2886|nr:hypothetical protein [Chthonobacter rhizosphaerae]